MHLDLKRPSPQRHRKMTSQGSARGRFTRAVKRGHLFAAETAAREMGAPAAGGTLGGSFGDLGLTVLDGASRKLRLPAPTLPE
jgi:hypothetical protein